MIDELINVIQPYAWGSRSALASLRGERESELPEAELWMGAHPLAPSRLASGQATLLGRISQQSRALLGESVDQRYAGKLPFLLKVLAAATPLSLQAHPSLAQAAAGFAADEAAGIPLDAPHRNYKDANHKPELLCALSEFWALCGFRPVPQTLALLDQLALPELGALRQTLARAPDEIGLREAFSSIMQGSPSQQRELAARSAQACRAQLGASSRFADVYAWAVRIAELYPGDVGLVSALLLNLVRLEAGQAIYLPAGNLHAYLGGTGVEIMASSDNVLRGGLTPKHVDVPELLRVLDFRPMAVETLLPEQAGAEHVYPAAAHEFRLSYFDSSAEPLELARRGPEIWLVTSGSFELREDEQRLKLTQGRSAFVSAGSAPLFLRGEGRIFRASVQLT